MFHFTSIDAREHHWILSECCACILAKVAFKATSNSKCLTKGLASNSETFQAWNTSNGNFGHDTFRNGNSYMESIFSAVSCQLQSTWEMNIFRPSGFRSSTLLAHLPPLHRYTRGVCMPKKGLKIQIWLLVLIYEYRFREFWAFKGTSSLMFTAVGLPHEATSTRQDAQREY